jgi:hypothetical protein
LVFAIVGISAAKAFAVCHVVTPTGSGTKTGVDWNNALANLPTTLMRGDVYYLADGAYGRYTFQTPSSGTATVEIRKAQVYDNCTATGWNASTMGSGQAVFSNGNGTLQITSPYLIVNGNGTQAAIGCGGAPGSTVTSGPPTPLDCGIKVDNSQCLGGCYAPIGLTAANITFNYVEIVGDSTPSANDDMEVFNVAGGPTSWSHIYGHNAGCVYFQDGVDSWTLSNSYFWGTEVGGTLSDGCHGQFSFSSGSDSNSTVYNNVFRDITGTAVWTFANTSTTHNNWTFYNNVIWASSPMASWSPYLSDGLIACINAGTNCMNFVFVQNTIANLSSSSQNGINNENAGSYTVENNLWYNNGFGTTFNAGTGGIYTQQYNSFLQAPGGPAGTQNVIVTSAIPDPFVSWASGNFNVALENSAWTNRLALGSPYTTDPAGTTRSTDRGTYQYASVVILPPTIISATVN